MSEKLTHEISDLRCSLSILEHKHQQAELKLSAHESQVEQLSRLEDTLAQTKEKLEAAERASQVEQLRFARDRKTWDEKLSRLAAELHTERQAVQRTDIVAKYEAALQQRSDLLHASLRAVSVVSKLSNAPANLDDSELVRIYLDKALTQHSSASKATLSRATSLVLHADHNGFSPPKRPLPIDDDDADTKTLFDQLRNNTAKIPVEKRTTLLRRFVDSALANVDESRCFSETSGFPDARQDPASLVNHIAVVTAERDALLAKFAALEHRQQLLTATKAPTATSAAPSPQSPTQQPAEKSPATRDPRSPKTPNSARVGSRA